MPVGAEISNVLVGAELCGDAWAKNVKLTCTAHGGQFGGVFTMTKTNFGKLDRVSGTEPPGTSVELAPGEFRRWEATYAPQTHSASEGDIQAVAQFAEHLSGDVCSDESQMTVVELELEPATYRDGFPNRHCWGVGETIHCSARPDIGEWNMSGGGEFGGWGSAKDYTCPLVSDGSSLSYSAGTANYNFVISIVEPSAILATPTVTYDFGHGPNHAGGVGMKFDVYVLPTTVSFSGIAMEEVPSTDGVHEGYFANPYFRNDWYHTVAHGAGTWLDVFADNYCGEDEVAMEMDIPRILPDGSMTFNVNEGVWLNGWMVWRINWGWAKNNRNLGDLPVKEISTPYNVTFQIDEYGTLSLSKFQHRVVRETNCVIRLYQILSR